MALKQYFLLVILSMVCSSAMACAVSTIAEIDGWALMAWIVLYGIGAAITTRKVIKQHFKIPAHYVSHKHFWQSITLLLAIVTVYTFHNSYQQATMCSVAIDFHWSLVLVSVFSCLIFMTTLVPAYYQQQLSFRTPAAFVVILYLLVPPLNFAYILFIAYQLYTKFL